MSIGFQPGLQFPIPDKSYKYHLVQDAEISEQNEASFSDDNNKCQMCCLGPHWIPIITATYAPLSFVITYVTSVQLGHVDPVFPYISDTGTIPPESGVFGLALTVSAVLTGLTAYIRYQHIELFTGDKHGKLNRTCLLVGGSASVGLVIIANFPKAHVRNIHIFGATLAFGFGGLYMWLNTLMSFKLFPDIGTKRTSIAQFLICTSSMIAGIICVSSDFVSIHQHHKKDERHWKPDDGGYVAHLISTLSEVIMVVGFCLYQLTFVPEFRRLQINHMTVVSRSRLIKDEENERVLDTENDGK